jgi:hypothetical protein
MLYIRSKRKWYIVNTYGSIRQEHGRALLYTTHHSNHFHKLVTSNQNIGFSAALYSLYDYSHSGSHHHPSLTLTKNHKLTVIGRQVCHNFNK